MEIVVIGFEKGDVIFVNGIVLMFDVFLIEFNRLGGKYGIGRVDLVENWFVGMKFCGVYEMFGGMILFVVYCGMELIIFDCVVVYLKDEFMFCYVVLIYGGFWFFLEWEML